jgi:hypothetical protein
MSRTLKLVLLAAILEMSAVALAVAAWRFQALGWSLESLAAPERGRFLAGTLMLAFLPVWLALGAGFTARKMAKPGLKAAPDTRRYNEITLMAAAAFAVGVQAWGVGSVLGVIPKGEAQLRAIEALSGVFLMVAGNFLAKTSPPTGPRAPDPAAWTRGMLRIGWTGVAAGLVIVVAAITVAIDRMIWVIFTACGGYVLASVLQYRAMRQKPA